MDERSIDMDAFGEAFDSVFRDRWAEIVRPKIAEIESQNEQLDDTHASLLLRQSQRLERQIAGWRQVVGTRRYERDRELIGDLFELLDDQVEAFQRFALMLTPRRERA